MFITLIATIAAGFLGAGCVMLLRFVIKDRVPRWATPIAAGSFMLAATISSEYAWYGNAVSGLPDGFEIVDTRERQAAWQPWTYLRPYTVSFVALDGESTRINSGDADLKIVDLYIFTRWQSTRQLQMAVDCGLGRRADPAEGIEMDSEGRPEGVTWRDVGAEDPLFGAACG